MIKVSILYPYQEGVRFDHDYYRDRHMPLCQELLGEHCKGYTVDRGLAGATLDTPPPYIAMCHLFFESLETFQIAMGAHAERLNADVINYTDLLPQVQVSEVRAGRD
ncbi:EthD family reductase [Pseudomonas sp. JDS28PS106]|uniref:EthD family reductase n=1 Tax=Pseudomonas sp. JDS28PS106 TaxID=2497235 RepID=UPI002FD5DBF1